MTAMNLVVQPAAGAAFLLTDTAQYRPDGTVSGFRHKVLLKRVRGRVRVAIATTGIAYGPHLARCLSKLRPACVCDVLAALPDMFGDISREMGRIGAAETCGTSHMSAVVAAYDPDTQAPSGWAISNDRTLFPSRWYKPFTLQPVIKSLTRYAGRPFPRDTDMTDPARWNPHEGAVALIEAQRADPFGREGATYHGVGGRAFLTRIDAEGEHRQLVRVWPDRVGELIDPSRLVEPMSTISTGRPLIWRGFVGRFTAAPHSTPRSTRKSA